MYVFNPVGLGGIDVDDHVRPAHRLRRPGDGDRARHRHARRHLARRVGDREFWDDQARRILAALLHAAALGGKTMRDVQSWVADPEPGAPEVPVAAAPLRSAAFESDVDAVHRHQRPHPHLDHLDDHARARLAHPPGRRGRRRSPGAAFDVAELLRSRGRRCSCSAGRRPRPRRWCAR